MNDDEIDYQHIKVVIIGNAGVGKTSMLTRYLKQTFDEHTSTTYGANYLEKKIQKGENNYRLEIWDTAGQERFRTIAPLYYRDAQGVIIVYDVTNRKSLEALNGWLGDVQERGEKQVVICIAGNKIDLKMDQEIEGLDGKIWADEKQLKFFGTSAKSGHGIDKIFDQIITELEKGNREFFEQRNRKKTMALNKKNLPQNAKRNGKKKSCCGT